MKNVLDMTLVVIDGEIFTLRSMWRNGRRFKRNRMMNESQEDEHIERVNPTVFVTIASTLFYFLNGWMN